MRKPGEGALMSDDWKWVLKESASTRPVLRMLPGASGSDADPNQSASGSPFSDTRGVLNLSAGDAGSLGSSSSQSDLGTAFALATSVFGHNIVQLSGNVGYSRAHGTAGGRIPYQLQPRWIRSGGGRHGAAGVLDRASDGVARVARMSVSMHDSRIVTENLRLDYGGSFDSVTYMDHLNTLNQIRASDLRPGGCWQIKGCVQHRAGLPLNC